MFESSYAHKLRASLANVIISKLLYVCMYVFSFSKVSKKSLQAFWLRFNCVLLRACACVIFFVLPLAPVRFALELRSKCLFYFKHKQRTPFSRRLHSTQKWEFSFFFVSPVSYFLIHMPLFNFIHFEWVLLFLLSLSFCC